MIAILLISLLLGAQSGPNAKQFHQVGKNVFPRSILERDLCPDGDKNECWQEFQDQGKVWAGDVNDDGVDELLVFPGAGWSGSSGDWYFLYQRRTKRWVRLYPNQGGFGWQVSDPRFDILPIVHGGYHDLRIAGDWCLKWNGKNYVDYEDSDYHQLSPSFFDHSKWTEAIILWVIHNKGVDDIRDFKPQWYPVSDDWWAVAQSAQTGTTQVEDPKYGIEWIAPFRGVWGWKDDRAFLLLPPRYRVDLLELNGDWLIIHGERPDPFAAPPVVARYNRRTHELRIEE